MSVVYENNRLIFILIIKFIHWNMEKLNHDWITQGLIDFEFKKYVLLAYLKNVRKEFLLNKLFPFLSDLVFHYKNLLRIKENKEIVYESFPKSISKADFKKLKISYKRLIEDNDMMKEIEDIIFFAIPKFEEYINEGKELYELVEGNMELTSVGLTPIYFDEGYLFLNRENENEVFIYFYNLTVFKNHQENFRGISTNFIQKENKSIFNSYESIKMQLIRKNKQLPNPATYLILSKLNYPVPETILPVAKRLLVRHLSAA